MKGRILDISALVDIATGRTRYGRALVELAVDRVIPLGLPASALMAAWAVLDPKSRLSLAVLTELSVTVMIPLGVDDAWAGGALLEHQARGGMPVDVVAGHVAAIGRSRGWPVVSDRAAVLHALAEDLVIEPLP